MSTGWRQQLSTIRPAPLHDGATHFLFSELGCGQDVWIKAQFVDCATWQENTSG
jgi:hypothetical protein